MTGCRSHGDLIGPYVLGGLEPAEHEEMRKHLAECDRCAAERRRLASLPALLDSAQAEDTIASLSPQLEDAVLDRFVGERTQAARPPRRWSRFAIPAAAAATARSRSCSRSCSPAAMTRACTPARALEHVGRVLGSASAAEVDSGLT